MTGSTKPRMSRIVLALVTALALAGVTAPLGALAAPQARTLRGRLVVVHQDFPLIGDRYFLDQHGVLGDELSFPQPPGLRPNTPVRVSGMEIESVLHVNQFQRLGSAAPPPATTGTKKLLVILLDWGPGLSTTQPTADSFVFGATDTQRRSVAQYYTDVSYGQLTWTGQVTQILTVADPGACPLNTIANEGDAAATTAGYTLSNFDNKMYVFPDPNAACRSAGFGQIAGARSWLADGLWDMNDGYARMAPDHELGHNLGEYHGHGLECGADVITQSCITGAQGSRCEDGVGAPCVSEYGDAFDLMGNNWTSNDYDSVNWMGLWHERQLGWVDGRVTTDPQPAAPADHTFDIAPIEQSTGNVGLVLSTAVGHTYVLEYREALGQDAFLTHFPDATSGVLISRDDPVAGTDPGPVSVDTSPDSSLAPFCLDLTEYCDWFDASLNVNSTYTDIDGAFTLTVNSASSSGANVTVHWAAGGSSITEMDPVVAYNGWAGVSNPAASGGTYRVSVTKSEKVIWKSPVSTAVTWSTFKGPDRGIAKVVIDGISKGNVDLYAASAAPVSLSFNGLASQVHTVTVTLLGTKNVASSGLGVVVDAFAAGSTTNQDDSIKITYVTWKGAASTSAAGGTYRFATGATARATLQFSGTGVDWITAKGKSYGMAEVIIDGVNKGTFDLYAGAQAWKTVLPFTGLAPGPHTLVVHVLGVKNALSTGTKVLVDGFTAHA